VLPYAPLTTNSFAKPTGLCSFFGRHLTARCMILGMFVRTRPESGKMVVNILTPLRGSVSRTRPSVTGSAQNVSFVFSIRPSAF
jgi:hypothetical protein